MGFFDGGRGASELLDPSVLSVSLSEIWRSFPGHKIVEAVTKGFETVLWTLPNLDRLGFGNMALNQFDVDAIAETLPGLSSLNMWSTFITDAGVLTIAKRLRSLSSLTLSYCNVGDQGAAAVARGLTGLAALNLYGSGIGDDGAIEIARNLRGLIDLNLGNNRIGKTGVLAFEGGGLSHLNLEYNYLGTDGAVAIAKRVGSLLSVNLGHNDIGDEGAVALARHLTDLNELDLAGNDIGRQGAGSIARAFPALANLNLQDNSLGDDGATVIAERLVQLADLNLGDNHIRTDGAVAIANNLRNLTSLNLSRNPIRTQGATAIAEGLPQLMCLELGEARVHQAGAESLARKLTNLKTLGLWSNSIGNEGARAIAEGAPQITHLDLANNLIDDEGAGAIARHLVNLTVLNLSFNSIDDDGCLAITRALPNLRRLELRANRIGDGGIAVIGNLTLLNRLDLGHNRICSRGAIAIAAQLPSLIGLNLTHNSIGGEGAIAIANRCFHLTGLNLAHNNIEERGISGLLDALGEVSHGWLRTLDLSGNPGLEHLGMPELVDSVDAQAIPATRSELREAQFRGGVPFGEAKLVVLGDGAVGKTSLLNALINHVACDPTESKTPGVEHRVWNPRWTIPSGPGQAEVRLNVWDFGGQVILQQTHQYFLTERCISLIVHDSRDEDDRVVRSWLNVVKARAPHSPVIVVVNKCDDGAHNIDFDRLREDFPEIDEVFAVSCKRQEDLPTGFDGPHETICAVRDQIVELLRTDSRLKSVQTPVPPSWVRVRDEIRKRAADQEVMAASEFVTICASADHPDARVDNPDSQRGLLRMLHQMGGLVAHGLTDETRSLDGLTLLDPNWLTTAIYALLADSELRERDGVFDRDIMMKVLLRRDNVDPASYGQDRIDYIIGMMQRPEFTLAFRLPGSDEPPQYLLAEALPSATPAVAKGWEKDSLRFRYRYPEYRQSLIPTFLVVAHEHFGPDPSRWRFGCTLEIIGCPILITADREAKTIDVAVAGDGHRREALAVVRSLFEAVHKRLPEADPKERVPLPDNPVSDVGYQHLLEIVNKDSPDEMIRPEGGAGKYRAGDLLYGVHKGVVSNPAGPRGQGRDISINIENRNTNTNGETPPAGDEAVRTAMLPRGVGRSWADRIGILSIAGGLLGALLGLAVLFGRDKGWPLDEVLRLVTLGALLGGAAGLLLGWIRGDH